MNFHRKKRVRQFQRLFSLLLSAALFLPARSQNTIGIPTIINYTKQAYNAGSQNAGIAQDKNGILYFANSQGLLTFDGSFWRKYSLPNKTIVRSVAVDKDNRIYVGGQSELGYFQADAKGELVYTSLLPLISEQGKDFTDVWTICLFEGRVFFRAYRKLLAYDGKTITAYDGIYWSFLGTSASGLLAFDNHKGLVRYSAGQWLPVQSNTAFPAGVNVKASLPIGRDSTLLITLTHGLYLLHHDSLTRFASKELDGVAGQHIYGASLLDGDRIALITNLAGCIIINYKGAFVQRLTKKEGIQNNNVLSAFLDRDKNLWLGLDNGIDLVLSNNAIQQIFPEQEDRNAGFSSILYQNKLYFGLSTGAYVVPVDGTKDLSYTNGAFELVEGSKGQVWNFSLVNGKLLMGHANGAYTIAEGKASLLDGKSGFWLFQPLKGGEQAGAMLGGNYDGINFYDYKNGSFFNPKIHVRFESARFIVQHRNVIWAAHPYKGLYQIRHNEKGDAVVSLYVDKKGILSPNHNKLFDIADKMILVTDKGIFEYKDEEEDFVPARFLEKALQLKTVSYLNQDRYGNLWFSRDKKMGVWDRMGGQAKVFFLPELSNKIQADGFENVTVIDSNNVLIAGEKGFFHVNYSLYKNNKHPLRVFVSTVKTIQGDSVLYGGYAPPAAMPALKYQLNSLHFESATALFGQESTLEYSYFLKGFDKEWTEWSKKTEKDYTNIPPGRYTFKVKCRNGAGNESPEAVYAFTVLPPWYRTWWAYAFYALAVAGILFLFYRRQQQKYKRQQQLRLARQQQEYQEEEQRLQMKHQLALSESETQIAQLQKEKLQAEIEHKNTELASSAMNLVHKAGLLSKLKEDLLLLKEGPPPERGARELHKIIKAIDNELDGVAEWEQFARHFDSVHANYLEKLKAYCPELTISELKLAAYLRLNLSTKEMAQLLNISVRGVETGRYRLRKKLGLTNDEANLYDFLIRISKT